MIAHTPEPPYYAVVFTSLRAPVDGEGYAQTAEHMLALAAEQPGYLGVESARGADGLGLTVSYWRDEGAIAAWKSHADHVTAREAGRARWYAAYAVRVCKVERAYGFASPRPARQE